MSIYAIGDLHLGNLVDKPMNIFGEHWNNHEQKIKENWIKVVKSEDIVLIPGDISWAMTMEDVHPDLLFIENLPGKKILLKGNHDYWWKTVSKLNIMFNTMFFLQNNYYVYEDYAICGTRGWLCPNDTKFTEHDEKIYLKEVNRLEISISKAVKDGYTKIIVMMHYPPVNDKLEKTGFIELIEKYEVFKVIYGHLHGEEFFANALQGINDGIEYKLVSSDYLNFKCYKIL